jgi:hypothetical protein
MINKMIVDGMHYHPECNCKSCRKIRRQNDWWEKNIEDKKKEESKELILPYPKQDKFNFKEIKQLK